MSAGDPSRSIGEVAHRLGLEPDTLRWFERQGVVPGPERDPGGRRVYSDDDVHLIEVLLHLRGTGMPLAEVARFTELVGLDPDGVKERLELLVAHRDRVVREQARIAASLRVVEQKIADYAARVG